MSISEMDGLMLNDALSRIKGLDAAAMERAKAHCDGLIKPTGSLGALEEIAIRLSGITGEVQNSVFPARVYVMCADNGVASPGIAITPQRVTSVQAVNTALGKTGVAVLCAAVGACAIPVDLGCAYDITHPGVLSRRIRRGTANIAEGPAMSRGEAVAAIGVGLEMAELAAKDGVRFLGAGELGIGNTTTSAACLSALTGADEKLTVGRGAGVTDEGLILKRETVRRALEANAPYADALDILHKLGGLDIAAMCGLYLGAAIYRIPIVIDGYISAVAALFAFRLSQESAGYMFASHISAEPGYAIVQREMGLSPILDMRMRLGEGSGCPLFFSVASCACAMMGGMGKFGTDLDGITGDYLKAAPTSELFAPPQKK